MASRWTGAEDAWLASFYPTHTVDETRAEHDRLFPPRGKQAIACRASRLGLRRDVPHVEWTPEMRGWFRAYVPGHTEREISAECERAWGFPLTEGQIGSAKSALGVRSGTHGGRWEPGHAPSNKGRKWDDYMGPEAQERCRATCYRKGNMPWNGEGKPIGYLRLSKDGYIEMKVRPRPSRPDCNDNFVGLHRLLWCWRRHVREVPEGHVVAFADHDRWNFAPDNLVLVPRSDWAKMCREGSPYSDADSLMACEARAMLSREIGRRSR